MIADSNFSEINDPRRKKFECEKCDRLYISWEGLKYHMQSHLGKKIYICIKMPLFRDVFNIAILHILLSASDDPLKLKFNCDVCGKIYRSSLGLSSHKKSYHGEKN